MHHRDCGQPNSTENVDQDWHWSILNYYSIKEFFGPRNLSMININIIFEGDTYDLRWF